MEKQEKKAYLAECVASSLAQTGVLPHCWSHSATHPNKNPRLSLLPHPLWSAFVRRGTSPSDRRRHLPWELQHREEGKTKAQRLLSQAAWTIPVIHWHQDFSGESAKMTWSWFVVQRRKSPFLPSFSLTSLCCLSALFLFIVHPPLQAALHVVLINPCWVPL